MLGLKVAGQRVDGWADILRGRIGEQLIEPRNVGAAQPANHAGVVYANQQISTACIGERHQLGCQGIDIAEIALELMATVFTTGKDLMKLSRSHEASLGIAADKSYSWRIIPYERARWPIRRRSISSRLCPKVVIQGIQHHA